MATIKSVIFRERQDCRGNCMVKVRVTEKRKRTYVSTGEKVPASAWDDDHGRLRPRAPGAARINSFLGRFEESIRERINFARIEGVSARSAVAAARRPAPDFFEFASEWIRRYDTPSSLGTLKRYEVTLRFLRSFCASQRMSELPFRGLDPAFISRFAAWLSRGGNATNTVASKLKGVRAILTAAKVEGFVEEVPFGPGRYRIAHDHDTYRAALTLEEVRRLEAAEMPGPASAAARDAWLLQFHLGGLRIGDVASLRWSDVRDGRVFIRSQKTGKQVERELSPKALEIVERYRRPGATYVMPLIREGFRGPVTEGVKAATARTNRLLRFAAQAVGVERITTHMARHSFARIAASELTTQEVQAVLGHSSLAVTQRYLGAISHARTSANVAAISSMV